MLLTSQQNPGVDSYKDFQKKNNIENNRFFIMRNKKSNKFETDFMLMDYIFFPIITDTDYGEEIKIIIPVIFYYENNELKFVKCPYEEKFTEDVGYQIEYGHLEAIFRDIINLEIINRHFEIKYLDDLDINNITDEYYDNFDSKYNYDNSKLYKYINRECSMIENKSSYYKNDITNDVYYKLFENYIYEINNKYFSYIGLSINPNCYPYFDKYAYFDKSIKDCAFNILKKNEKIKKELKNNSSINFIMIKNDEKESLVGTSFLIESEKTYFEINIPYIFSMNILEFIIHNEIKGVFDSTIYTENSTFDEYLRIYDYIISGEIKEIVIIKDSEKEYNNYIQKKFKNNSYIKKYENS